MITSEGTQLLHAGGLRHVLPHDTPPELAHVEVTLLQQLLLDLLGIPDRIEDLTYTADAAAGVEAVRAGKADALFLVRAPSLEQVRGAAAAGLRMPPKSTHFHPKPRTGLVLRALDEP